MKNPYWLASGAAILLVGGALGVLAAPSQARTAYASGTKTSLTVTGQANWNVTPNQASVTLGDQESAKTASQALQHSNQVTQAIIQAIEKDGVKASAIATSGLNLSPMYGQSSGMVSPPITGYQAMNMVTVTLHQMSQVGGVIDGAAAAGANQIQGINFGVGNTSSAYKLVYKAALADARNQAQAILGPLHERILGIRSIQAQQSGSGVTVNETRMTAAYSVPVMPGSTPVQAQVTVVYRVGP